MTVYVNVIVYITNMPRNFSDIIDINFIKD